MATRAQTKFAALRSAPPPFASGASCRNKLPIARSRWTISSCSNTINHLIHFSIGSSNHVSLYIHFCITIGGYRC